MLLCVGFVVAGNRTVLALQAGGVIVVRKFRHSLFYVALINRAGGLYGRILTEVVSTDRTQRGLCISV